MAILVLVSLNKSFYYYLVLVLLQEGYGLHSPT